jgi:hypothetical protein
MEVLMSCALLLVVLGFTKADDGHDRQNRLYRELRTEGVLVSARGRARLPAPTMADGLSAEAQEDVIKRLAGADYPVDELLRKSVVAPHIFKFRDVEPSDPKAPAYGIDVWFVAYGDLDVLAKKDVNSFFGANRKDVTTHILSNSELAERKLSLPSKKEGDGEERYVHVVYPMLDRVQIEMTTSSISTKTADSQLVATELDRRFTGDPTFPNQWHEILHDEDDAKPKLGPPHPYECTAFYLKISRLRQPRGALFVEYHRVSTEPNEWFHGANLLRSKFPIVIQSEVRAFRREAVKTLASE